MTTRPVTLPAARCLRCAGFTLVELMIVVVIIGILATVGGSIYTGHILAANLEQAMPHLMNIAAKNRIHHHRTGYYLASAAEEEIQKKLGVDLSDAGDFCFMIFCNATEVGGNRCGGYADANAVAYGAATPTDRTLGAFVTDTDTTPQTAFQVVAVLRAKADTPPTTGTVSGAGQTCSPSYVNAPVKLEPQGWVRPASVGGRGSAGRVVVLSYPPPPDGRNSSSTLVGSHSVTPEWRQGVTVSDALTD